MLPKLSRNGPKMVAFGEASVIHMYIYMPKYIDIYLYICLCMCIYMYIYDALYVCGYLFVFVHPLADVV